MIIVKSLNNLTNEYIKKILYPMTLGNIYVSVMKGFLLKKPWVKFKNRYYSFILKQKKLYIGWSLFDIKTKSIMIYIKNAFRRKGYGTFIFNKIKSFCKRKNINFKKTIVTSHNKANFNFFKSLGYKPSYKSIVIGNVHRL